VANENRRRGGFCAHRSGYRAWVTRSPHGTDDVPGATPPAERPPTDEVALVRGRVEQTPVTLINWVALLIGAVVVLALVVVVAAYLIA